MLKSKFAKTFIAGMSLSIMFTSAAYANTDDTILFTTQVEPAVVTEQLNEINEDILAKQREIDKYLFEDHVDEIKAKGFTVTHTGPMEDYVEIGITPYTEENANYLYEIFGKDNIKVVEGQQAVLYDTGVATTDAETVPPDASVSSGAGAVSPDTPVSSDAATDTPGVAADVSITSADTALESTSTAESSASIPLPLIYALGGVLIVGGHCYCCL
jgi:hypothetical protein